MNLFSRFRRSDKALNSASSSADFAAQSRRSMRKIISLVVIAIFMFVAFFLYGLQSSVKAGEQLSAIKDVYFPVLEKIDATIVNIDRIEALMLQSVMSGEVEELGYTDAAYISTKNLLNNIRAIYPEQDEVIVTLQEQFEVYFSFAKNTTQMLLANRGKDELGQSVHMNRLLLELRRHLVAFRESSYRNFLSTLDESRNTSELNFYMSIGAGAINLLFMAILVFFIRLLNRQNNSVSHSLDQVATLLNNSGQGFFSFGADLKIVGEYSQACVELLGQVPTGRGADEVLFPFTSVSGISSRKLMRACIEDALQAKAPYLAAMYLELIPVEFIINRKTLKAQYIPIDSGFMVVLSNISAEVELRHNAELESKRMGMILAAVTDGTEFVANIEAFVKFSKAGPEPWLTQGLVNLYRAIHTFKGSFNQLRFTHVPAALHEVEAMLQDQSITQNLLGDDSENWLVSTVFATDWLALLNRDIAIVTSVLGDNYFSLGGAIPLQLEHARAFEQMANELLRTKEIKVGHEQLLKELSEVRYISLHKELSVFSKLLQQVAMQLEKELVPLEINGEDVHLDPDIYRQFLLTLGHVMRNAIDHGIEDPDSRYNKGKNEAGTIRCSTSLIANEFELIIQDDGAGINEAALRLHALEKLGMNVDNLTLVDLVFADGLSSRETATELSGRGIGMAAVRAEVLCLGGAVTVETVPEEGTRFIFRIPILKDIAA
jgi:two-component sensor histidine kinase